MMMMMIIILLHLYYVLSHRPPNCHLIIQIDTLEEKKPKFNGEENFNN